MRASLVFNPSAGDEAESLAELTRCLGDGGLTVSVHLSKGGGVEEALSQPADLIIVAGGDGTVAKVALALAGQDIPMAVLPFGTANNLACALGSWPDATALAEGWRHATRRRLDVAAAEGPWGRRRLVEAAGFGAFARAVERADERGLKGIEAGRAAFRAVLGAAEPLRLSLTVDGVAMELQTLLLEVMNIGLLGPNLRLAPEVAPGDGRLALVSLPPNRRDALLGWLEAPEAGPPPTDCHMARHIRLDWPGGTFRLDDEALSQEAPGMIELKQQGEALHVLVPPGSREQQA